MNTFSPHLLVTPSILCTYEPPSSHLPPATINNLLTKLPLCFSCFFTGGKTVSIHVDPRKLPPGVHVAFVRVFDERNASLGPVCNVPITVVKPEVIHI